MFYAHFVLSKKGPLAKIWLAAHWDKKLTKAHIFETDIEDSVDAIIQPKVKLALRTSGHLLLGVVRIYSRKAKYLLADCNEALVKIKMAFRPGTVDLPEENREAAVAAITLAENFYDFENVMVDMADFELPSQYNFNQCRPEEITIREEFGERSFIGDDGFGEIGFDSFVMPDIRLDDPLYVTSVRPPPDSDAESPDASAVMDAIPEEMPMEVDNDEVAQPNVDLVEVTEPDFQQPAIEPVADDLSDYEGPAGIEDDDSDQDGFGTRLDTNVFDENMVDKSDRLFEEPESVIEPLPTLASDANLPPLEPDTDIYEHREQDVPCVTEQTALVGVDQTTLISNDAEAFALMPIDVTSVGTERKAKKKRKLIVDEQKAISSEAMKVQLANGTDLVTPLDLAPPTKKLMQWKESGGVERLLVLPGRLLLCKGLSQLYTCNLITHASDEEEVVVPAKETRKRKETEEDVEGMRRSKRSNGIAKRGNDISVPELSLLADNSAVEEPRQEDVSAHEVLDRTAQISFADSLQISNLPADDTLTNATSPTQLDEPLMPVFPDGPQTPRPDLVLPELPPCPQLPSFADESRSTVQLESFLVEENPENPRHHDEPLSVSMVEPRSHMSEWAEPLSVSIVEPRSIMSEWAGGDDDLDDSIFNENVHANVGGNEAARFLDDEQEEDQIISNKRSSQMLHMLQRLFQTRDCVGMRKDLLARNNRKQVASKFYTLLVLKKLTAIDVFQKESYGDIIITKGPAFDSIQ